MTALHAPLGATQAWVEVTARFEGLCQCLRHCGVSHPATPLFVPDAPGLLCGRADRPGLRLVVAPVEPMPAHLAALVPADELTVWCPECWGAVNRAVARHADRERAEQPGLFPEPEHVPGRRGSRRTARSSR